MNEMFGGRDLRQDGPWSYRCGEPAAWQLSPWCSSQSAILDLMRLLFLDFDGVLNSDSYFASPEFLASTEGLSDAEVMLLGRSYQLDLAKVALLNRIVEGSNAEVVISSSWRLRYTLEELNAMLEERKATFRAVAMTPRVTQHDPARPLRAREILAYLEGLTEAPDAVLVLDDDSLGGLVPGHIRLDGALGLEERDLERCIQVLKERSQAP